MNRRKLLIAAPALALLGPSALRAADEVRLHAYSRGEYTKALASGEPFLLDFYAPW